MASQIHEPAAVRRTTEHPAAPPIAADAVRKSYPVGDSAVEISHGVALRIEAGEIAAVMGPSGSGKSTLLYCLAGLEDPTAGAITLAGRPLAGLSRAERARMRRDRVGFVFQSYNLIPTLTASENVALPYTLGRRRPPRGLVAQTLATVGLAERADARPPSMSGGEQQRVALARVLAQQPEVIFADEPTGALDTRTGELILAELVRIGHTPGRCVLVVTHDPAVAAACDRVRPRPVPARRPARARAGRGVRRAGRRDPRGARRPAGGVICCASTWRNSASRGRRGSASPSRSSPRTSR